MALNFNLDLSVSESVLTVSTFTLTFLFFILNTFSSSWRAFLSTFFRSDVMVVSC